MIKKFFKFIINEFLYNGHFQTLGSLSIIIFSSILLKIKITWDILLIVYIAFYLIYLHDRYQNIDIDSLTNQTRSQHLKIIYKYIPFILIIGLFALLTLLLYFSNKQSILFVILIVLFGFLYPIYFKKLTKKIPLFKNFYVASVFALLVLLPIIYYSVAINNTMAKILSIIFLFTFIRALMMQFFLDIKDFEGDKKLGLLTLCILRGKDEVYSIINIINFLSIIYLLYFLTYISNELLLLSMPIILLPLWSSYYFQLTKKGNYLGFVLGSGEFVYWLIFIYLGEILIRIMS